RVLDEVVDLDDVRVLDLGEEPLLVDRGGHGGRVAGVDQSFEDDPPAVDVEVPGEVDPADAAVGERAQHLVLTTDEVAGLELGHERERRAAFVAGALRLAWTTVGAASDLRVAAAAEPFRLRDDGVGQHRLGRIAVRHLRHLDQARAQPASPRRPRRRAPRGARRRAPSGACAGTRAGAAGARAAAGATASGATASGAAATGSAAGAAARPTSRSAAGPVR